LAIHAYTLLYISIKRQNLNEFASSISNLTDENREKVKAVNSFDKPTVVIFDLYGTLVKFGVMHHPFRALLKWAREQGRSARGDDARQLMTVDADLFHLARHLDINVPEQMLAQLQSQIDEELASLTLFDDVIPTLEKLQSLRIPIAICSNLAQPYGVVIDRLLPQMELHRFLSYEVGFIKPEPLMYHRIVTDLCVDSAQCLFIGDTVIADYQGPIKNGMQARHLTRGHPPASQALSSLNAVIELLD
jgi:HAD superfamily hydrolase (TIGR01549 family)